MTRSPRLSAAKTIYRVIKDGAYSNIELFGEEKPNPANQNEDLDKALHLAIVKTSLERKTTLDFVISRFVKTPPDLKTLTFLYVGASQILYFDKIPFSAACDETVKAAKTDLDKKRTGFINGVLRNICRSKDIILAEISSEADSVKYSLDPGICSLIRRQYPEKADEIFASMFVKPPLYLRPNTLRTDEVKLAEFLTQNGIGAVAEDGTFEVTSSPEKALRFISTGMFYIQGYPSQKAVKALGVKKGITVIDVCACPGGKALGAAIDMENSGRVIALDIHENKFSLLKKSAATLGVTIIKTKAHDSREALKDLTGAADAVICDVPCSSLGVIPQKPEVRFKKLFGGNKSDPKSIGGLESLLDTQSRILAAGSSYVKPGGVIVYSTCTVNKDENQSQVEKFLKNNKNFSLEAEKQFLISPGGGFYGFYIAKLRKNR